MIGQRLTEDGQAAAVQGPSGDRRHQHDGLVVHDEGDRGCGDVIMRRRDRHAASTRRVRVPTVPIAGDSPDAEAIKVLARGHQNLIWTRTRHTNSLRSALREYYPAALEVFDDLHDRDALAVLGRAPTPAEAAHLTLPAIRSALKKAGRQRNLDTRAREIRAGLRAEHLTAPAPVAAAFAATTRAAVGLIVELNRQITELEAELATHFESHPDADIYRSLPGLGVILGPGCSVSSGTTPTATPPPSLAETTPEPHP